MIIIYLLSLILIFESFVLFSIYKLANFNNVIDTFVVESNREELIENLLFEAIEYYKKNKIFIDLNSKKSQFILKKNIASNDLQSHTEYFIAQDILTIKIKIISDNRIINQASSELKIKNESNNQMQILTWKI